jgi:hypothetical protein
MQIKMGKKVGNMLCRKKTGEKCSWDSLVSGHLAQNWKDQKVSYKKLQLQQITKVSLLYTNLEK